jgi:hypothetical protein
MREGNPDRRPLHPTPLFARHPKVSGSPAEASEGLPGRLRVDRRDGSQDYLGQKRKRSQGEPRHVGLRIKGTEVPLALAAREA